MNSIRHSSQSVRHYSALFKTSHRDKAIAFIGWYCHLAGLVTKAEISPGHDYRIQAYANGPVAFGEVKVATIHTFERDGNCFLDVSFAFSRPWWLRVLEGGGMRWHKMPVKKTWIWPIPFSLPMQQLRLWGDLIHPDRIALALQCAGERCLDNTATNSPATAIWP